MDSIFENLYVNRELQSLLLASICSKYRLTRSELLVLLFLGENVQDTAADIVENLKIAKSQVSASVRDLEERGFIRSNYEGNNHRSIHLRLCENAAEIVRAGECVQKEFLSIICRDFSTEERRALKDYIARMTNNANEYLKEQKSRR